jgi:hypothetical protein
MKTTKNKQSNGSKPMKRSQASKQFIGRLKGVFKIVGDIESPVEPLEAWETLREFDELSERPGGRSGHSKVKRQS